MRTDLLPLLSPLVFGLVLALLGAASNARARKRLKLAMEESASPVRIETVKHSPPMTVKHSPPMTVVTAWISYGDVRALTTRHSHKTTAARHPGWSKTEGVPARES